MSTSEKKKFVWDEKMSEIYVKICAHEVRVGNRPTTHLNKKGWINLQEKFNLLSRKNLDVKQLKNKWNNLKKDWQIWKRLLGNETGLGWSTDKKTIEASDDWWEARLKEMPAAIKFREKGLLLSDEMDLIYGDAVATGHQTWTPSTGGLQIVDPTLEGLGDNNHIPQVGPVVDAHVEVSESKDKGKGKRLHSSSSTNKSKKKQIPSQSVQQSLEWLSDVVEAVHKKTCSEIESCIEILESLNAKDDLNFFYDCLFWLGKEKDMRKVLLCLKEPETQLGFLKKMVMEKKK